VLEVVPDINVLVSALINQYGFPGRIQAAWERGELLFITSIPIIAKADEVLHRPSIFNLLSSAYPAGQAEAQVQRFLHALRQRTRLTPHRLNLQVIVEDPEDDAILIAAVEGKAHSIISGDRHLKNLESYQGIPILSPAEFVTQHQIA
jgi:putative PIN family toxin of toxin-antitoxin system